MSYQADQHETDQWQYQRHCMAEDYKELARHRAKAGDIHGAEKARAMAPQFEEG